MPATGYLTDERTKKLIHGYRACVSYIDELLGQLLNALEENGLAENTIVVLWGDHGWKLGEYGEWCKHSNQELDTNVTLFVSAPGFNKEQQSYSIVEFIDVYPTLCDLAGLSKPEHLRGCSLLPILKNPQEKVKDYALSQYPRKKDGENLMGYSIRTDQYRYTSWVKSDDKNKTAVYQELYDQSSGKVVKENLAGNREYKKVVERFDLLLEDVPVNN
jgi:iduronate 2-sulfatase